MLRLSGDGNGGQLWRLPRCRAIISVVMVAGEHAFQGGVPVDEVMPQGASNMEGDQDQQYGPQHFLVDEGVARDARFWQLAQALSALYPRNCEEKRWVDGLLSRKKSLGF